MYERFLPALEARKQLIMQLALIRANILKERELMEAMLEEMSSGHLFIGMLNGC